jgi:diguanylate cyclase (GGDEF)-like protein
MSSGQTPASENSQYDYLTYSEAVMCEIPSCADRFWFPEVQSLDRDPLMNYEGPDVDPEDEDLELDHLMSQVAFCTPAANAGFDEMRDFRRVLLEAARAVAMRFRYLSKLRSFALTDDLTGLYNRRGFLVLGLQHIKLARRNRQPLMLFFVDIDEFKRVNDELGHLEGDAFLICCADVLRNTFRDCDVIARLGGDEFVILAQENGETCRETILSGLESALLALNGKVDSPHKLSLSVGAARFDPQNPVTLGELLTLADRAMFEHKRGKTSAVPDRKAYSPPSAEAPV